MKLTYQNFLKQGIDLAPLGIEKRDEEYPYFCTPKGARIFGWAGMDGIHYCLIRGFGEMVFAVSPMNTAPHYVHPLAQNFSDFLRLLLACGDSAALEQAWQWNEEQFAAFLADHLPTEEQKAVLAKIAEQTGISPMEDPWQYLHELQTSFDFSKIQYTEDFYDPDMNPDAPQKIPEWKVTFEGEFRRTGRGERAGKELVLRREFDWAGRRWLIPSVYLCGKGMVVDFCMRVEPLDIQAFIQKWDLTAEDGEERQFSREQQMQLDLDNPLHLDFRAVLHVNGKDLDSTHGYGTSYNPCLKRESAMEKAAQWMEHYGLDSSFGWVFYRACYPWATKRKPEIRRFSVTMIQNAVPVPGVRFQVGGPGDTVSFSYHDQGYCLTVQEYEAQTMDWSCMPDPDLERPSHYVAMSYTVAPELPDNLLNLADCDEGDRPRQKSLPGQPVASSFAMVMGMIGGADGPTAVLYGPNRQGKLHAVCSSLHFEPVEQVEWQILFYEKPFEDVTVDLLLP